MSLPLTLPAYALTPTASVQVVINPNYYTALVNFYSGPTLIATVAVMQADPTVNIPDNLVLGSTTLTSGSVTLQIPGNIIPGNITLAAKGTDGPTKQPLNINAIVAQWNLNQ